MTDIREGMICKITTAEQRLFKVKGFTQGSKTIPSGWLIDENGTAINPKYVEQYHGATSVFNFKRKLKS